MKSFLTLLLVCCLGLVGAQNPIVPLSVSGRVFFGEGNQPARNVQINYYTERGRNFVLTNAEGFYSIGTEVRVEPDAPYVKVTLVVDNFCNNIPIQKTLYVNRDSSVFTNVNFRICENTDPPEPRNECKAFFTYKVDPAAPKTVYFQNLSYSSNPIVKWLWNFGDSTTSNLQNPVHTYARAGIYQVLLSVTAQRGDSTCTAMFRLSIYVRDLNDCNCTREYNPVCVTVAGGNKVIFPNKCVAQCAGYTEAQIGACRDTSCVCPAIFQPVCVRLPNGTIQQFGNACEAACKGFTERDFVECRRDTCNCPTDEYNPVCVVVNGDTLTFSNKCIAFCKGYKERDFVRCRPNDCVCPAVYDPVCVKLPGGIIKEFGNKCRALCVGFDENDIVPCDTTSCGCPKILDPVCAVGPNGDTLTFPNRCFAVCKGYSPDSLFQCRRNDCICPEIYDPVCVVVNGDTLRFDNACLAECKGYTPRQYFRCGQDTTECGCPRNLDPVCVKVNGELKRFPNACVARCQGFSERDLVPCLRDTSDCVCPLNYAPVCAIGPDGDTLTFTNRCFAACKGYEGNEIFTCERDSIRETCIAGFTVARSDSAASLTVKFVDIAKTLEGTILGWKWDFGDGSSDDSQNPVHTFPRPGLYTVTQYIATSTGCTARFSRVVYVGRDTVAGGRSCQAIFTFTQRPTNPNVIQFKNLSQGSNLSILWEFGDGNTSREPNPTHTYAYNGVFFVRLTVRSGDCTHTMSMVLFIDPSALYDDDCKALFLPVLFVDSLQIAFRNLSSSDAIGFRWDFGDGTTSTEFAPIHTYREKKIYTVTLTITTANGCSNTFRAIINLGTQDFTGNPAYRTLETTGTNDVEVLQQLKLYPNPVKNELNLSFTAPAAGDYQIQIFSLEGKLLQQRRENMLIGNNVLQLPTDQLSAGMYLLRLQSEGQTTSLRFIKQ